MEAEPHLGARWGGRTGTPEGFVQRCARGAVGVLLKFPHPSPSLLAKLSEHAAQLHGAKVLQALLPLLALLACVVQAVAGRGQAGGAIVVGVVG